MGITGIDHWVIVVADVPRTLAFYERLGRPIAWEKRPGRDAAYSYYDHWLGALEDVLVHQGTLSMDEVTARARTLARRPRGHDHITHIHPE